MSTSPGFTAKRSVFKSTITPSLYIPDAAIGLIKAQWSWDWLPGTCHSRCDVAHAVCSATGSKEICDAAAAACHAYCESP